MTVYELTRQLIALQSFDDGKLYEKPMVDFIVPFCKTHFPWLSVTLQDVGKNRQNIFLKDDAQTKLLVIDQIDTVIPDQNWTTDPLIAELNAGKLYGLGSSDSKGSVAAFFTALQSFKKTKGLAMLLYVDEEYFFKGMRHYIDSNLAKTINPDIVLSIDGNGSALGTGCRGLVEFDIIIRSESGHTANSLLTGAVQTFIDVFKQFQLWLKKYNNPDQGIPTAQIAMIRGGLLLGGDKLGPIFGNEGNRIPNYLESKIEIRTTPNLTFSEIESFWNSELAKFQLLSVSLRPIFDYHGFSTPKSNLQQIIDAIKQESANILYLDPTNFGYLDIAMMKQIYPRTNLCSFGIGEPGVIHKANEYITIDSLDEGVITYNKILKHLVS